MKLPALLLSFAAILPAEQPWLKLTSSNFEVFTTAGEKKARQAILYFEQVRSFFLKAMNAKPASQARVRIIAFNSEAQYKPYQLRQSAAYAAQDSDGDLIVMRGIADEEYPVAVHEYTHTLLRPLGERIPLWFNEGLAEIYSTLKPAGHKVTVGTPIPSRLLTLRDSRWLLLEKLFAAGYDSPEYNDPKLMPVFYAESWALAHMLTLDEDYRANFNVFSKAMLTGTPPQDAIRRAWNKDVIEVWKDLQRYVRQDRWFYRVFDITLEKSAEAPELGPAPPVEVAVVLVNLLAGARKDDAPAAFARLLRDFPDRPEAAEAAGYFALHEQRLDEARAQFARAVALGARRAAVYSDYARLLPPVRENRVQRLDLLAKALQLDPADRQVRYFYALTLLENERFEQAAAQFDQLAGPFEPARAFEYFHAAAYAHYRLGKLDQARAFLDRARPLAQGGQVRMLQELERALRPPPPPAVEQAATPVPEARDEPEPAEPPPPPKPVLVALEGILDRLDCLGSKARVRVRAAAGPLYLVIDDPRVGDTPLSCGPQKPRAVQVEYQPRPDPGTTAVGMSAPSATTEPRLRFESNICRPRSYTWLWAASSPTCGMRCACCGKLLVSRPPPSSPWRWALASTPPFSASFTPFSSSRCPTGIPAAWSSCTRGSPSSPRRP